MEYGTPQLQQVKEEFEALLELAKGKKLILEIGTCQGGTLRKLMQVADPEAVFVSIDMPNGVFGGEWGQPPEEEMQGWRLPGQTLHIIRADSHTDETRRKVMEILDGRKFDFAFIDGDHTFEGVKLDYLLYDNLIDGIVSFHDILHHPNFPTVGVDRFWNEIKYANAKFRWLELVKDYKQGWAGIGVLYN